MSLHSICALVLLRELNAQSTSLRACFKSVHCTNSSVLVFLFCLGAEGNSEEGFRLAPWQHVRNKKAFFSWWLLAASIPSERNWITHNIYRASKVLRNIGTFVTVSVRISVMLYYFGNCTEIWVPNVFFSFSQFRLCGTKNGVAKKPVMKVSNI